MCYVLLNRGKMKLLEFTKKIPARLQWNLSWLTVVEFIYIAAIQFMLKYADTQLFVEGGWIENLQLVILGSALIIALRSPTDKALFTALSLVIVLMLMRETNLGRSYFCEKYLSPDEICRWKKMKYGFIVEPLRDLYVVYILYYIWSKKVYQTIWQYILHAPVFVWDSLVLIGAAVAATLAEFPFIDNEILEESCEMLMYIAFTSLVWKYSRRT